MEWFFSLLKDLGVETKYLIIVILMALLIIWLYKQIVSQMSKHFDREIIQIESSLASYSSLYKLCVKKNGEITVEEMLRNLIDHVRYTDKKLYLSIEDAIISNQPLDNYIAEIREEILNLKENLDVYILIEDKKKFSSGILSNLRLIENIFLPVIFTIILFCVLIFLIFVSLLPMLGLINLFLICIIIIFVVAYFYILFVLIIDKSFKHSKTSYFMLITFIITIPLLIWINNLYVLIIAALGTFIFIVLSLQYLKKQ